MNINTKYHGKIDVKEDAVLNFEQGIPGFANERKFILLPLPENDWFHILQSVTTPELGFVVTDPFLYTKEFDFELDQGSVESLGFTDGKNVKVLTILTMKETLHDSTANLQAPIVINLANNKAKQVILSDSNYKTKHLIFAQPEQAGKE